MGYIGLVWFGLKSKYLCTKAPLVSALERGKYFFYANFGLHCVNWMCENVAKMSRVTLLVAPILTKNRINKKTGG